MARTKPSTRKMLTRSSRPVTRARARKKEQNSASTLLSGTREKQKSKAAPYKRKTAKPKPSTQKLFTIGKKVRVWWPPTRNKKRTDFSGAYWPSKVVDCFDGGYRVEYDNGEREDVSAEDVSPASPPVAFGEEMEPLAEREYCEVFNESETDPSAWLAQVQGKEADHYIVNFPFHDSEPEKIPERRIRRARVFNERTWKLIKPGQEWDDGEIEGPLELELIDESLLQSALASLDKVDMEASVTVRSDGRKVKNIGSIVNGLQGKKEVASETKSQASAPVHTKREQKNKTKRKDPNAPKKPRSSYVFFMEKERKLVKEKNPEMRPQHVMKLVGENWATLSPKDREEFEEMARADRARYREEMKDYVPPEAAAEEPGSKRPKIQKDYPKKPLTAFMIFSNDLRRKLGQMDATEKTKKIAETWKEMTEEQRQAFEGAAREDKERYDKEIAEIEATAADRDRLQQAALMRNFAEVTSIGFQPPPLTRTSAPVSSLDDESKKILSEFDIKKCHEDIIKQFKEEAYYNLLGVWREASENLGDAIRAYKAHIAGRDEADWRAFFTSVWGVDKTAEWTKPDEPPASKSD